MKRLLLLIATLVLTASQLSAQNYIVVNSEKIFKSIPAYNQAISDLDALAKQYQAEVDEKFESIEALYNNYMESKHALSSSDQQAYEQLILDKEKLAQQFREGIFGKEGSLLKKRQEMIRPIQQKVFSTIEEYAKKIGADMVLDSSNNPTILYNNPNIEQTQQIIDLLK